ncbi:hypothetical protein OQA88_11416 [Cercophora sp. LCS_1]
MRLQLSPKLGGGPLYNVFPLTRNLGLNDTNDRALKSVKIMGNIVLAEPETYELLNVTETIAYISCDNANSSEIVNMVMDMNSDGNLKAILLYSIKGNCCGLQGSELSFTSIFTMGTSAEALAALEITRAAEGNVGANIMGNWTVDRPGDGESQSGSNSAVAMSILYSITGLITLLFLVIIATGAIRAHRYPERYGPRSGYGGRPRQSRAKGLARAVLETIPIVKFGDPAPPKLDPAYELEQQSRSSPDPLARPRLSAIPEEPRTPQKKEPATPKVATIPEATTVTTTQGLTVAGASAVGSGTRHGPDDEHPGCSICTEDFTVGEDVRVLPCDHKFHPTCIDPWLINVSGTCPLCRLDLRPQGEKAADGQEDLPPPLSVEWTDNDEGLGSSREQRRSSRILDFHRLRQATVEERIAILRRHRTEQQQQPSPSQAATEGDNEERGRRARLADRMRDRFRIRTRTQSPSRTN